jgi:hypothetical protein
LRCRYNKAVDINGMYSNGSGGYQTETAGNGGFEVRQFLQLNSNSIASVDISWNEMINAPTNCRPEDFINIYASSGTAGSPMSIANNFAWGGFSQQPYTLDFSGCGLLVEEGSSYIDLDDNVIVAYTNSGFAAWGACDNLNVRRNRFICSGKLSGTTLWAPNRAAVFQTSGSSNLYEDNEFSWMGRDTGGSGALSNRGLYKAGDTVTETGSTQLANATEASEAAEVTTWESKKTSNGVTTGSSIVIW